MRYFIWGLFILGLLAYLFGTLVGGGVVNLRMSPVANGCTTIAGIAVMVATGIEMWRRTLLPGVRRYSLPDPPPPDMAD